MNRSHLFLFCVYLSFIYHALPKLVMQFGLNYLQDSFVTKTQNTRNIITYLNLILNFTLILLQVTVCQIVCHLFRINFNRTESFCQLKSIRLILQFHNEALESVMCDVIKIRLKSISFLGVSFLILLSSLLFRRIVTNSHVTLSSASFKMFFV